MDDFPWTFSHSFVPLVPLPDYTRVSDAGLFFVEDQLGYLSMGTAFTTTMPGQICQVLCKQHSSLDTWLASAMASSSCLELWASVPLYCLSVTYTSLSSVSN